MRRYERAAPATIERRTPARQAGSIEGDLVVPLAQALVSGILAGLLAGAIADILGASRPLMVGGLTGGIILAAIWALGLADRRALLWTVETVTRMDLDHDGAVGPPVQPPVTTVEVVDRERKRIQYLDLPLDDRQLEQLARRVLRPGGAFTRQAAAGIMTNDVYQVVIDRLLGGGLLHTRGDGVTTGVELTASGRAWLRHYV